VTPPVPCGRWHGPNRKNGAVRRGKTHRSESSRIDEGDDPEREPGGCSLGISKTMPAQCGSRRLRRCNPRPAGPAGQQKTRRGRSRAGCDQWRDVSAMATAAAPITVPASVGLRASRSKARSPGWDGLLRSSLAFGAAVRLGLLPHTTSRRQHRASHDGPRCVQLPSAHGCYQLAP
jgi:hypothetical protein